MKFSGFNTTAKIGIGTNDPGRSLHVRGEGNTSVVRVGDGDTDGAAAIAYIEFGADGSSWNRHSYVGSAGADSHLWIVNEENADIKFYANNAEKMVIKNDGNVGINTTSPSAILHIKSSGTARNVFYVAASDNSHLAGIYEESDGRGALNVRNAAGTATINLDSGNDSWFTGGNFGIGTTSLYAGTNVTSLTINATSYPSLALYIGGTISHLITGVSNILNIDAIGNRSIALRTNDVDRLTISGAGAATFSGALTGTSAAFSGVLTAGTTNYQIQTSHSGGNDSAIITRAANADNKHLEFRAKNANYNQLFLSTTGRVGIGDNGPDYTLDVAGTFRATGVGIFGGALTGTSAAFTGPVKVDDGYGFTTNSANTTGLFPHSVNGVGIRIANAEKLIIKSDGKVGIGTTAPSGLLDLYEPASGDNKLRFHSATTGTGTSNGSRIGLNGSELFINNLESSTIKIYTQSTQTNGICIANDGKVGIGTAIPLDKLHVQGNILQLDGSPEYHFGTTSASHRNWRVACQEDVSQGFEIASGTTSAGTGAPSDTYTNRFVIKGATGQIQFNSYGGGTHTGTSAYKLSVDAGGNIIETSIGAGAVDGSGTTNYISKWTDSDTLGNSSIHEAGAGSLQIEGPSAGRFLTLNAPTTGGYITFETADTAFADIGTPKAISGIATYSTTDLMINARSGAKNIVFGMNGYEKVRIDSNGKVGIGVADPDSSLEIKGAGGAEGLTFKTTDSSGNNCFWVKDGGQVGLHYFPFKINQDNTDTDCPASTFFYVHHASAPFIIKNDGNVGIGTTAPGHPLVVVTPTGDKGISLTNSSNVELIHMRQEAGDSGAIALKDGGNVKVWLTSRPSSNSYFNVSGANLGVGTASPGGKLEVDGSSTTVPLLIKAGTGATSIKFVGRSGDHISSLDFFQNDGSSGGAYFQCNGTWMRARADGGVHFRNGNTPVTTSSDFTINGMSLGIGTTAPDRMLHLYGGASGQATPTASSLLVLEDDGNNNYISFLNPNTGNAGIMWGDPQDSARAQIIYSHADNKMTLNAGGAVHMTITSGGKVYIGDTTASDAQLRVKQSTNGEWAVNVINQQATAYGLSIDTSSSSTTAAFNFAAYTPAGTGFFLENTGDVGIGTTGPSSKLHIYKTTNAFLNGLTIENPNAGSSASAGMYLNCNGKTLDMRIYNALSGDFGYINSSGTLYTGLYHDGGLVLSAKSGKVGIGTTAPSGAKLDVRTNSASLIDAGATVNIEEDAAWTQGLALYINNADVYNADYAAACIGVANSGSNIIITAGAKVVNNPASSNGYKTLNSTAPSVYRQMNGAHVFYGDTGKTANTLYTPTERMRIDDDGDVGIGTNAPSYRLSVFNTTASDNKTIAHFEGQGIGGSTDAGGQYISVNRTGPISQANGVMGGIIFGRSVPTGSCSIIRNNYKYTAGRNLEFLTSADNSADPVIRMRIKGDGNVGIGTVSPDNILDIRSSGTPTLAVRNTGTSTNATLHLGEVNQTAYGVELRYEGNLGNLFLDNRYNHATRPHMYFRMRVAGTPITAMTIDPAGNVGIGTTAPPELLSVMPSTGDAALAIYQVGGNANNYDCRLKFMKSDGWQLESFKYNENSNSGYDFGINFNRNQYTGTFYIGHNGSHQFTILNSGSIGIGDASPSYKLDVNGTFRSTGAAYFNGAAYTTGQAYNGGLRIGGAGGSSYAFAGERLFTIPAFPNGVANQKVDLYWTAAFWGYMEIEITGSYTHQNMTGVLTKSFTLGLNTSNSIVHNESWYSNVGGLTAGNFAISDVTWDSTNSRYRIQIVHRVSTGNTVRLKLRCLGDSAAITDTFMSGTSVSAIYTTDTTAFDMPVKQLAAPNDNAWVDGYLGIGTTSPTTNLHIKPASGNARLKLESDLNTADVEMMLDSAGSTRNAHITFYTNGTQKGGVGYVASDTIMKMWGDNNPADDHLCINSSGSVGIGTANPDTKLTVYHTSGNVVKFKGQGGSDTHRFGATGVTNIYGQTGSVLFNITNSGAGDYVDVGSGAFRVKKDGKVGIGTDTCSSILHVDAEMSLGQDDNNRSMLGYSNSTNRLYIGTKQGGTNYFDTVSVTSGKVGIGTVSPGAPLQVDHSGGADVDILILDSDRNTIYDKWGIKFQDSFRTRARIQAISLNAGNAGGALAFEVGYSTDTVERMRINNLGNVGIGTDNPGGRLETYVTAGGQFGLRLNSNFAGGNAVDFKPYISSVSNAGFSIDLATSTKFVINSDGNVGIGTTSPSATLHVRDTSTSTSRWTAAFVADNASAVSAQSHDHVLIQSNDVPSLKFYEYGQDQVGGIAVGDNNATISTTEAMRFYVNGSATGPLHDGLNGTCALKLQTNGTSDFYGNVNIANNKMLSVGTGASNSSGKVRLYGGSGTAYYMDYQPVGTQDRNFRFNGSSSGSAYTTYFNQQGSGNHNVYVDGDITSAGTGRYIYAVNLNVTGYKNFEIEHPTKEKMMLVHSSLEGPEAGVYHRGRVQSDTIALPDYWTGLVRDGTITVQLTPNGSFQHLYVVSTSLTEIKIGAAEGETIDCYYVIYGERADVASLIVEDADAWQRFQERKAAMNDGKA
jgi:hypothetical protein